MARWEYKIVPTVMDLSLDRRLRQLEAAEEDLNMRGTEHWELVGVYPLSSAVLLSEFTDGFLGIFKRPRGGS